MARAETYTLVQVRDKQGFWGNAAEYLASDLKLAKQQAQNLSIELHATVRVVLGPERKVVTLFTPKESDDDI